MQSDIQTLSLIELAQMSEDGWKNIRLPAVNDQIVQLRLVRNRAANMHVHHESDEMFHCIIAQGAVYMDFEDHSVPLRVGDMIVVPKGQRHRLNVPGFAAFLIVDKITES